jgi:hypothetical protein
MVLDYCLSALIFSSPFRGSSLLVHFLLFEYCEWFTWGYTSILNGSSPKANKYSFFFSFALFCVNLEDDIRSPRSRSRYPFCPQHLLQVY